VFFYWLVFLGVCDVADGQVVRQPSGNGQVVVKDGQVVVKNGQGVVKGGQEVVKNGQERSLLRREDKEMRGCLVKTALSQTHVRELTGRNDGVEVRKYLKILHLPEGTPYCGVFIEWVYRQCGTNSNVQSPAAAYSWMKYPQRIVWNKGPIRGKKPPQSGDIAVFTWRQRTTNSVRHHCELVAEWEDDDEVDDFVTIGANTSAPQTRSPVFVKVKGEGVHKKLRDKETAVVSNHISSSFSSNKGLLKPISIF